MTRYELEHLLRAASQISVERDVVVFGSQAILGSFTEDQLPDEAIYSVEADVTFFEDDDDIKSDQVDGAIGELSPFHEMYGIYAQGVSITTAVLPDGWRDRVVILNTDATSPGRGLCLEPHDLVISKLVAGRDKDHKFAASLLRKGLIDASTLLGRLADLDVDDTNKQRIANWIEHIGFKTGDE